MTRRYPNLRNRRILQIIPYLFVLLISIGLTPSPSIAQTANQPLNLGDVIQRSTEGAPAPRVYLKLPESVPIPALKPDPSEVATEPAQGEAQSGTDQTEGTNPSLGAETGTSEPATAAEQQPSANPPSSPISLEAQPQAPVIQPGGIAHLHLEALLSDDGQILQRGVNWRIFEEKREQNGQLHMLHNVDGGAFDVELEPGSYVVYSGYGYANLTKRIVLEKAGNYSESFNLRAGAIRLNAVATGDIPLDDNILRFDIFTRDEANSAALEEVVKNVKPEHVVKLTEGTYHIVSSYGSSNAKVRGDVEVQAGKLINVTMIHSAAKVTLRLVSEPGGEALANTVWTVLTPGGDVVKRAIGAFPTLALSAGDYTAIAKQNNEIYNRDFSVDSGLDRDIEVLAKAQ